MTAVREARVNLRLKGRELQLLTSAARRQGETLSAWVRSVSLRAAALVLEQPEPNGRRTEPARSAS